MKICRWGLIWRVTGPTTSALGRQIDIHPLTAEETGAKITELLKEIERLNRMPPDEHSEYMKYNDCISSDIHIVPWDEVIV